MRIKKMWMLFCLLLAVAFTAACQAQDEVKSERDIHIPTTISEQAKAVLAKLIEAKPYLRMVPAPDAIEQWKKTQQAIENQSNKGAQAAIEKNKVTVKELELGGVPVLDIRPENWDDNGKVLVYTQVVLT